MEKLLKGSQKSQMAYKSEIYAILSLFMIILQNSWELLWLGV